MNQHSEPRVAVVGTGHWGQNLVRNFKELGALTAVCDADEARLQAMAERHGPSLRSLTDYAAVLADDTIDAIALATPAATHEEMTAAALEAGKDVFVEKPLALSVTGGRRLVEMAGSTGRILMVGHLLWYHPAIIALKDAVDSGRLGEVQYVYSNRLNFGKFRTEENILWSFAPHDISVILGLLGEMPTEVDARGGSYLNTDVADVTVSTLAFASGARAHIFVSWLHPFKEQRLVVVGEKSMATFEDGPEGPSLLFYDHDISWEGGRPEASKKDPIEVPLVGTEPLRRECEHFLDCVRTRTPPLTDAAEGLRVLEVLQRCQGALDDAMTPLPS